MTVLLYSLGLMPAPVIDGNTCEYIDGKPKRATRKIQHNDGLSHGERQRERILDAVDEYGEVDTLILSDELAITRHGVTVHMTQLVSDGVLEKHYPEKRGPGNPVTWTRAKAKPDPDVVDLDPLMASVIGRR